MSKNEPSLASKATGFIINNANNIPRQGWAERQDALIKQGVQPSAWGNLMGYFTDVIDFDDQEAKRKAIKRAYVDEIQNRKDANSWAKQNGKPLPYSEEQLYAPTDSWKRLLETGRLPEEFEEQVVKSSGF